MTVSQPPLFDYDALDTATSTLVQQRTDEIKALMRRTAEDIIAIGRKLAEVKAHLGHGRFLDWLAAEFGWHRFTANRFMQVAEVFADLEMSQIVTFAPSALYLLAAPSTPETARVEALERVATGEAITYSQARAIITRHQAFPMTAGDPTGTAGAALAALGSGEEATCIDIRDSAAHDAEAIPAQPPASDDAAALEELVAGVEGWLAGRSALAEARAAILAEIAARSTTGLDHLNALLTSGALPASFRNRDVLVACKVVQASLPDGGQAAGDRGQKSGVSEQEAEVGLTPDPCSLTPDSAVPDWPLGRALDLGPVSIIRGDARQLAALLPLASVHLIITSPPYNVGIGYRSHDDALADDEYIALLRASFGQCSAVLVDGGRIAVVVPAGVGRNPWRPLASRVAGLLADAGLTLRGQIVWDKGTCGNRTTWGSFRLPTDPSLRDTTETIVIAHKESSHLAVPDGCLRRDASGPYSPFMPDADTFMTLAQDHWQIAPESATTVGHPAPFPVALAERLIRFYAYPGAHVADPFAGSGTVGVAAARLGCRATLLDIDASYCSLAQRRLSRELPGR
jgi:site-specific DNA-methyltransferase (adenine-specific)